LKGCQCESVQVVRKVPVSGYRKVTVGISRFECPLWVKRTFTSCPLYVRL
jgi:hypothetical protein